MFIHDITQPVRFGTLALQLVFVVTLLLDPKAHVFAGMDPEARNVYENVSEGASFQVRVHKEDADYKFNQGANGEKLFLIDKAQEIYDRWGYEVNWGFDPTVSKAGETDGTAYLTQDRNEETGKVKDYYTAEVDTVLSPKWRKQFQDAREAFHGSLGFAVAFLGLELLSLLLFGGTMLLGWITFCCGAFHLFGCGMMIFFMCENSDYRYNWYINLFTVVAPCLVELSGQWYLWYTKYHGLYWG